MPQLEDAFSIRYGDRWSPERLFRALDGALRPLGFAARQQRQETFHGLTEADMMQIAAATLPDRIYRQLQSDHRLTLPPGKLDILAKPIDLTLYTWQDPKATVTVEAELAAADQWPLVGADLWLKEDIEYAGGFITIRTRSLTKFENLRRALRDLFALNTP